VKKQIEVKVCRRTSGKGKRARLRAALRRKMQLVVLQQLLSSSLILLLLACFTLYPMTLQLWWLEWWRWWWQWQWKMAFVIEIDIRIEG
jgi:hypothetical protein